MIRMRFLKRGLKNSGNLSPTIALFIRCIIIRCWPLGDSSSCSTACNLGHEQSHLATSCASDLESHVLGPETYRLEGWSGSRRWTRFLPENLDATVVSEPLGTKGLSKVPFELVILVRGPGPMIWTSGTASSQLPTGAPFSVG